MTTFRPHLHPLLTPLSSRFVAAVAAALPLMLPLCLPPASAWEVAPDPLGLAAQVTIYRDHWGVPHIDGPTDASVIFGFAYAQAEDHLWQIEQSYAMALGRQAELDGEKGLEHDVRTRAFEIPTRARVDFADREKTSQAARTVAEAFVAGLNYYLQTHPEVMPRLFDRFEPWHVLAFSRFLALEFSFGTAHVPRRARDRIWERKGSNAWALAPSRTRDGRAMLLINPHQPWYGFGQFIEVHLRSGEGWSFSGATFPGSPIPSLGHNEEAGWAFTVNEPDVADAWRVAFDDPEHPLRYRYGDGHREATEWKEVVLVKTSTGLERREITLRKTHHGPIVGQLSEAEALAVRIAPLDGGFGADQALAMLRVRNLGDFKRAMARLTFPIFNAVYADRHGDIYYLYNGVIPRRDPGFDWRQPLDGSDSRTEWQGIHPLEELPQITNPPSGYLQSCNSSPFVTAGGAELADAHFPSYMCEDSNVDKRRSKLSRRILGDLHGVTFEQLHDLAFDTRLYWPLVELPALKEEFDRVGPTQPELAARARPFLEHLLDWDCRVEPRSTQATLCVAWYQELYGSGYPGETLRDVYVREPAQKFEALCQAAARLQLLFGSWRTPYEDVYRLQRHAHVADFTAIPFDDDLPSLPCLGAPGPMGIVFTVYSTPSIVIPFVKVLKHRYAIVGSSYMAVIEFGERVRARSLLAHGESGNAGSPHFFDQAEGMSRRQMKEQLFHWEDVVAGAEKVYHPGQAK